MLRCRYMTRSATDRHLRLRRGGGSFTGGSSKLHISRGVALARFGNDCSVSKLLCTHSVGYPFIEVLRTHNRFYARDSHIVSDGIAYAGESKTDASFL
jgi:hypothetical protein